MVQNSKTSSWCGCEWYRTARLQVGVVMSGTEQQDFKLVLLSEVQNSKTSCWCGCEWYMTARPQVGVVVSGTEQQDFKQTTATMNNGSL